MHPHLMVKCRPTRCGKSTFGCMTTRTNKWMRLPVAKTSGPESNDQQFVVRLTRKDATGVQYEERGALV